MQLVLELWEPAPLRAVRNLLTCKLDTRKPASNSQQCEPSLKIWDSQSLFFLGMSLVCMSTHRIAFCQMTVRVNMVCCILYYLMEIGNHGSDKEVWRKKRHSYPGYAFRDEGLERRSSDYARLAAFRSWMHRILVSINADKLTTPICK